MRADTKALTRFVRKGHRALAVAALLAGGCESLKQSAVVHGPTPPANNETAPDAGRSAADAGSPPPSVEVTIPDAGAVMPAEAGVAERVVVYAHTGSDLLSVDPTTLEIRRIGPFVINNNGVQQFLNNMSDIAVDSRGAILGLTFTRLLAIDPTSGACTPIATLPVGARFNGLSWLRTGTGEILVATAVDGNVYRLDPTTGASSVLGRLGQQLISSGDVVSVANYGTLITLRGPSYDPITRRSPMGDILARLDPVTGAATPIGQTGFNRIYGLGFWGNKVFGFTDVGEFILIDPMTGVGSLVRRDGAFPFWGAGVTTSVPVID